MKHNICYHVNGKHFYYWVNSEQCYMAVITRPDNVRFHVYFETYYDTPSDFEAIFDAIEISRDEKGCLYMETLDFAVDIRKATPLEISKYNRRTTYILTPNTDVMGYMIRMEVV